MTDRTRGLVIRIVTFRVFLIADLPDFASMMYELKVLGPLSLDKKSVAHSIFHEFPPLCGDPRADPFFSSRATDFVFYP